MNPAVIDKLFAAMQTAKGVPALENTVTGILTSLRDVKTPSPGLVAQISEDFAVTQKVLKLANSPMYAPFAEGVSSVSAALDILGGDALQQLVLGANLVSSSELKDDPALSRTLLASELARTVSTQRAEDVSVAALMIDLGTLLTARFLPEEMSAIERKVGAGRTADEAAQEVLGISIQELGVHVAQHWRLPSAIVSIIDGTGDATLVAVARFSSQAASLIHAGEAAAVNELVAALDVPGVDKARLGGLINRKLESASAAAAAAAPVREEPTDQGLGRLRNALVEEKTTTVEELARAMFPELARTLKTAHCLLFMTIKSGDFLIRCGYGKGIDELKGRLRIPAEFKPTAFHAAIKNNADVIIAEVGKLKSAALPDGYGVLLPDIASFIILPIETTRVSGLLYLDWEYRVELPPPTLTALRQLRDLFIGFCPR